MESGEDRDTLKNEILSYSREAKFYKDKLIRAGGLTKLKDRFTDLQDKTRILTEKSNELDSSQKLLRELDDLDEPTNEALKKRIPELKKKRLSLDLTFVE